MALVVGSGA